MRTNFELLFGIIYIIKVLQAYKADKVSNACHNYLHNHSYVLYKFDYNTQLNYYVSYLHVSLYSIHLDLILTICI